MFTLGLQRRFTARHFLVGGDWGPENETHSHPYRLEIRLEGERLDEHGFLLDLVDVERHLDDLVGRYRDRTLNDVAEFAGLNPSLEHFARIVCGSLADRLSAPGLTAIEVRLWEDDDAWASFRREL